MEITTLISKFIEKVLGKELKNKLKCYYRSTKYYPLKMRYSKGVISYIFPDKIIVKSVAYFNENPSTLLKGYLKEHSPEKNQVILDVGAFLGAFSIYLSKKFSGIEIIAFEPSKKNYNQLLRNIALNNSENIKVIKKGLWNSVSDQLISAEGANATIISRDTLSESINTTDLDSELKRLKIKKVDFIKMDIEGAEIEALRGMRNTLNKMSPKLAIATYHLRDGEKTYKKVTSILRGFGYSVKTGYLRHLTTWAKKSN